MWISKAVFEELQTRNKADFEQTQRYQLDIMNLTAQNIALKAELTRHVADKEWFMHRLNQVEGERAQLIYAATGGSGRAAEGVKIMAPQFSTAPPAGTMSENLNGQYNPFGTTGEDSADPQDQIPDDITHLPRFKQG
jgi:hypothetical protein